MMTLTFIGIGVYLVLSLSRLIVYLAYGGLASQGIVDIIQYERSSGYPTAIVFIIIAYIYLYRLVPSEWTAFRYWWMWAYIREHYFPVKYFDCPGPPPHGKIHLYVVAPHGLNSYMSGLGIAFNERFRHIRPTAAAQALKIPIFRELLYLTGHMDVGKQNVLASLNAGESVMIIAEGVKGMLRVPEGREGMLRTLGERRGFVRVALESREAPNISIVPVFIPAEWRIFDPKWMWIWPRGQEWLNSKIHYMGPNFSWGHYWFPIPKRIPVNIYFGNPVPLQHVYDSDLKSVEDVHAEVLRQFTEMSEQYRE